MAVEGNKRPMFHTTLRDPGQSIFGTDQERKAVRDLDPPSLLDPQENMSHVSGIGDPPTITTLAIERDQTVDLDPKTAVAGPRLEIAALALARKGTTTSPTEINGQGPVEIAVTRPAAWDILPIGIAESTHVAPFG